MPIMTGSTPLALPGGEGSVTEQGPAQAPLYPATFDRTEKKPRKPPKIRKPAFSHPATGKAFNK